MRTLVRRARLVAGLLAFTLVTFVQAQPSGEGAGGSTQTGTESLAESLQETKPEWSLTVGKVLWSLVVLAVGYLVIRYATAFLTALSERWVRLRLTIKRIHPVVRIAGWAIVLYIIIADVVAPPIATLVALTASAGIAVGLAAQDVLKNIFGGLMILFDRPFQVGDKIRVGEHYGEVTNIGLRSIRIVTANDSAVSIPNSEIVNHPVSNANSGETNCQVVADFFLPAHTDLVAAKALARRGAAVSSYAYLAKPIAVVTQNEMFEGRAFIRMSLKAYVLDIRFEQLFHGDMTELVMGALIREGIVDPADLVAVR